MEMDYDLGDEVMLFGVKKENKHYYLLLSETGGWQHYRIFAELLAEIRNNPETCIKMGKPACYDLCKKEEEAINRVQEQVVKAWELEERLKTDKERYVDEVLC